VLGDASITLPLDGRGLDAAGIIDDARLSSALRAAIAALAGAVYDQPVL
jgi:hypothetical protein